MRANLRLSTLGDKIMLYSGHLQRVEDVRIISKLQSNTIKLNKKVSAHIV